MPGNRPKNVARNRLSSVNGNGRRWATYQQTADYLGVTTRTIRQMVEDGRLTQYSLGPRVVRFDLGEVDAAMTPKASA
jgi:excisionase family DNA binding protein